MVATSGGKGSMAKEARIVVRLESPGGLECSSHGPGGIKLGPWPGGPAHIPLATCAHCEAEADLKHEDRLEAYILAVGAAAEALAENRPRDDRACWREDFEEALRNLIREARQ